MSTETLASGNGQNAVVLERATTHDIDAVVVLQFAAYARNRELLGLEPLPLLVDYKEIFETHEVWISRDGPSIVAALILQIRDNDILIWSISSDPGRQSKGIGNELLLAADIRTLELGRSVVRLYTGSTLQHLVTWYGRNGYKIEQIETLDDRSITHMVKHLTSRHGQIRKRKMVKFAANLSFMFNEVEFLDRFEAAANAGFKGVEYLFPYDYDPQELATRLQANGLTQALFNLPPGDWERGERGLAGLPGREADFEAALTKALAYAEATGCKLLHAMPGLRHHGAEWATYIANLRKGAKMAAGSGVSIIIEPINERDIPGFFLNSTAVARAAIYEVGEPNIGLQFDLYHRQIQEGDVARSIHEFGPLARHYQIANPPDRGEPDDGEMNYRYLFQQIDATGFDGWIGCEYKPRGTTTAGLGWPEKCGVTLG